MRRSAAIFCILLIASVSACSSDDPESAVSSKDHGAIHERGIVHLLRDTTSFRYTPYASPSAMLADVDIVVVGQVDHVATAIVADELDGTGALVVAVRPTEVWKGQPANKSGLIHFAVSRPKNLGLDVYKPALPAGTQVILFGVDHPPSTNFSSGDPGVATYTPVPQGLFLPDKVGELQNVWGQDTIGDEWAGTESLVGLRAAALGR